MFNFSILIILFESVALFSAIGHIVDMHGDLVYTPVYNSIQSANVIEYQQPINLLSYLPCNNILSYVEYMDDQKEGFYISSDEYPFNTTLFQKEFYTSCSRSDIIIHDTSFVRRFTTIDYSVFDYYERLKPIRDIWSTITNNIWKYCGWTMVVVHDEQYWIKQHKTSSNIVFFLHGLNGMNGLENLYTLNKLSKNSTVVFLTYNPNFVFVGGLMYINTFSEHIENLNSMIHSIIRDYSHLGTNNVINIIGNSYGTIRTVALCKRYPDTCSIFNNIVLLDPVTLNFPFSNLWKFTYHGLFVYTDQTNNIRQNSVIRVLRTRRQYDFIIDNVDWFEWNLDVAFITHYGKKLTLFIGKYDDLIKVRHDSPILNKCNVIYTETQHGLIILQDFLNDLPMFYEMK